MGSKINNSVLSLGSFVAPGVLASRQFQGVADFL